MSENLDWYEFTLDIDGVRAIAPCLQFTCHTWHKEGVGQFYERSRSALGDLISHYQTDSMRRNRKLDARAETIVPTWIERTRPGKTYWVRFSGGDDELGVSAASLELFFFETPPNAASAEGAAEVRSVYRKMFEEAGHVITPFVMILRVTFPIDHALAQSASLLPWIFELSCVKEYPFLSGHAGYALNVDHTLRRPAFGEVQKKLGSLLLRHPGLEWYRPGVSSDDLLLYNPARAEFIPVVERAAWVVLVADSTLERLGGRSGLRSALSDDAAIVVHDLPHGAIVQAGETPQLGDVARRDFLPAYRRVAEALRAVRRERIAGMGSDFDDEAAQEWLDAFDKEYD